MEEEPSDSFRFRVRDMTVRNSNKEIVEVLKNVLCVFTELEEKDGDMPSGVYHCAGGVLWHANQNGFTYAELVDRGLHHTLMRHAVPKVLNYDLIDFKDGAFFVMVPPACLEDEALMLPIRRISRIPGKQKVRIKLTRGMNFGYGGNIRNRQFVTVVDGPKMKSFDFTPYFADENSHIITFFDQ